MPRPTSARLIHQDICLDDTAKPDSSDRSPFDLGGHRAIVTGGTQGVGASIAIAHFASGSRRVVGWVYGMTNLRKLTLHRVDASAISAELLTVDLAQPPPQLPRPADGADRSRSCRVSTCWSTTPGLTSIPPSLIWTTSVFKRRCT